MNSTKVITDTISHNNLDLIKLEPDDSQGWSSNVPEQTEASSSGSQLSQNNAKSSKNKNGKFRNTL